MLLSAGFKNAELRLIHGRKGETTFRSKENLNHALISASANGFMAAVEHTCVFAVIKS